MKIRKLSDIASEPWIHAIEANALYNEPITDQEVFHFVYCFINLDDHRCYIGKHSTCDLNDGYTGSSGNSHYAYSCHYHLYEEFILGYCESSEEAYALEAKIVNKEFLDKYSKNGIFNCKVGGKGGIILSPELEKLRRQSMSVAHTGVPLSEEHRQAQSEGQKKRFEDLDQRRKQGDISRGKLWVHKPESHERYRISPEEFWYWEDMLFKEGRGPNKW